MSKQDHKDEPSPSEVLSGCLLRTLFIASVILQLLLYVYTAHYLAFILPLMFLPLESVPTEGIVAKTAIMIGFVFAFNVLTQLDSKQGDSDGQPYNSD